MTLFKNILTNTDQLQQHNDIHNKDKISLCKNYIQEIIIKLNLYDETSLTEELNYITLSIELDTKGDTLIPKIFNRSQFYDFKFSDNNTSELFTLRVFYLNQPQYQNDRSLISLSVYVENNEVKIDNEQLESLLNAANAEQLLSTTLTNFLYIKNPQNNQNEIEINNTLISTTINKINAYREKILQDKASHTEGIDFRAINKNN